KDRVGSLARNDGRQNERFAIEANLFAESPGVEPGQRVGMIEKAALPLRCHSPGVGEPMLRPMQIDQQYHTAQATDCSADLRYRTGPAVRVDPGVIDHSDKIGHSLGGKHSHSRLAVAGIGAPQTALLE